jgi:hypothetical protein
MVGAMTSNEDGNDLLRGMPTLGRPGYRSASGERSPGRGFLHRAA